MTYISVPVPVWEPVGESPLRATTLIKSTAQRTERAEPETARLGSSSISDTPKKSPSDTAWESYRACPVSVKAKYGKLLSDFCEYLQMCDRSGFSAEGIAAGSKCHAYHKQTQSVVNYVTGDIGLPKPTPSKNDFGKRKVSGPLLNRWHPIRRSAWIARMHQLSLWYEANRIEGCTLISLTGYQENSGLSWYDTLDKIGESRIKLMKILRKYFGKVSYFWVVEPHTENDTGYPHYHLVVFKYVDNYVRDKSDRIGWVKCETRQDESIWELQDGEGMEDKLRRLYTDEWKTGSHTYGLNFRQMRGENDIENLKNYLMKYISKGYINEQPWCPGELIFNAHLYGATHGARPSKEGEQPDLKGNYTKKYRIIGMSQDLSALLKPEIEDKEDIVWLHTDEVEPTEIKNDDGTITTEERKKVLYDRQLIPDWLDSKSHAIRQDVIAGYLNKFYKWIKDPFELLVEYQEFSPDSLAVKDWGRPTTAYTGYDRVTQVPYDEKAARRARAMRDNQWSE